jgi:hypothetical protein
MFKKFAKSSLVFLPHPSAILAGIEAADLLN